jgi:hypothetical protein
MRQKHDGREHWGKRVATDARADLSVDSNVLTHRTMSLPVGDNESHVWVSCGLALIELHESNPTP